MYHIEDYIVTFINIYIQPIPFQSNLHSPLPTENNWRIQQTVFSTFTGTFPISTFDIGFLKMGGKNYVFSLM